MSDALTSSLTYAVGIALSPVPIVAVILMLFSARPRLNSIVFTATWVLGIAAIVTLAAVVPGLGADADDRSTGRGIFRIALGVVFLLLAVRNWRRRPGPGEEPSTPRWLTPERGIGIRLAVILGLVLSVFNPKDLALAAAGGAAIGAKELSAGETVLAIVVFTAVAVSTVVLPVLVYLVVGARSEETFDRLKGWLLRHNAAFLAVIWLVLGAIFLLEGLAAVR